MAHGTLLHRTFGKSGRKVWWWVGAVVLVLGLAVVTNVGMAWWCVRSAQGVPSIAGSYVMIHSSRQRFAEVEASVGIWNGVEHASWPGMSIAATFEYFSHEDEIPRSLRRSMEAVFEAPSVVHTGPEYVEGEILVVGWPWRAFSCDWMVASGGGAGGIRTEVIRGAWRPESTTAQPIKRLMSDSSFLLFYRPVWPGFLWNTVLYSVLWGAVGALLIRLARWPAESRARRGRCRACGYDRRGLLSAAVCPECGLVPPARDWRREDARRKARVPRWGAWWWARGVATAIALGVLTNVLLAWWCLYRSQRVDANVWELFSVAPMEYPTASRSAWVGVESVVWPLPGAMSGFARQVNPQGEIPRSVLDAIGVVRRSRGVAAGEPDILIDELVMTGWPWLAFSCDARVTLSRQTPRILSDVVHGGWLPVGRAPFLIPFPHLISSPLLVYRPVWPGFVWNTALYGVAWVGVWGCWIGIVGLARLGRARFGHCRRCGYDLRGLPNTAACPECGLAARGDRAI